jgi:transposase InsO family protein
VARILELVRLHPRFGYRRVRALLVAEGWRVSRKRVHRLWRANGLRVPKKSRKKRRLGSSENGCVRRRSRGKGDVWCWDFIHDRTASGGPLKWLSVVDEYTRECVALEVRRSLPASEVGAVLEGLARPRGVPGHIRSDNGPEFIASAIRDWLSGAGVGALYVEPGSPWENGYAESFHSRLRDEFLGAEVFTSALEARVLGAEWRRAYNHERPHSSLGYRTPAAFAAEWGRGVPGRPGAPRSRPGGGC